jgi:hypothetical protein
MAGQGILLALPFIAPIGQFSTLAGVLAISQLIGALGGFSLELACPRLGVKLKWAAIYSFATITLAGIVVFLFFEKKIDQQYVTGLLLAWVVTFTAIMHSYALYRGKVQSYAVIGTAKAAIFLAVFFVGVTSFGNAVISWLLAAILSLIVTFLIIKFDGVFGGDVCQSSFAQSCQSVFLLAAPSAVIVALGTLPFVLDRAIAHQVLSSDDFARYTVAVTWAAPILYFGNIITNFMVSKADLDSFRTICRHGLMMLCLGASYMAALTLAAISFLEIPFFQSSFEFMRLWAPIATWFLLFTVVSAPVAAVVQKSFSAGEMHRIAVFMIAGVAIVGTIMYVMWGAVQRDTFSSTNWIVLASMVLAFTGLLPKMAIVARHLKRV